MSERRFCPRCGDYTLHEIMNEKRTTVNPRGRALYKCTKCGKVSSRRLYRPSSEVGY